MIDKAKEKIKEIHNILKDYEYQQITKPIMFEVFSLFKDKEEFLWFKNIIDNWNFETMGVILDYSGLTIFNKKIFIDIYFHKLICSSWMVDNLLLYYFFDSYKHILNEDIPKELNIKHKLILNIIKVQNPKYNNNII